LGEKGLGWSFYDADGTNAWVEQPRDMYSFAATAAAAAARS